jgi:hypothetical protein
VSDFAKCPNCGESDAKPAGFTWWGGVLGPKLLNHVICQSCKTGYNGKTGKDNTQAIVIYTVVGLAIGLGIAILMIAGGLLGGR